MSAVQCTFYFRLPGHGGETLGYAVATVLGRGGRAEGRSARGFVEIVYVNGGNPKDA
jgi:hypothetical protein